MDVERRANFDTRATRDQTTLASIRQLSSFVGFVAGNPYRTLWGMHIPLVYEDYPITDLTKEDRKILNKLSRKFLRSLATVDPSPDVMREIFTETNHGKKVFEFVKTAGQGDNSTWLATRGLKITASSAYKVLNFTKETAKRSFLRDHLWGMQQEKRREEAANRLPPAIQHGKTYEKKGVEKYLEYRKVFDSTVSVDDSMGLTMREDYPEFGCSPDAIVYSDYNAPRLLEIKCPFSLKNVHPENYEEALTIDQQRSFCLWTNAEGDILLKQEHAYYYQIQFSLGILGLDEADFMVYTFEGILVLPIKFDPVWWAVKAAELKEIHHKLLVPEYFLKRAPRNLLPFEINIHEKIPIRKKKTPATGKPTEEETNSSEDSDDDEGQEEEDDENTSVNEPEKDGHDGSPIDFNDTASLKYDEEETSTDLRDFVIGHLYDEDEDEDDWENSDSIDSNNSVTYSVTYDDEGNAYF